MPEVFVVDASNNRIQVFDLDGVFNRKWGSYGAGNGQLNYPIGIFCTTGKIQYLPIMGIG